MKKSALAAALALCALTGSAAAYENTFAGYAVKEKKPAITLQGQQLFFFSDVSDLKKLETEEDFNFHGVVCCSAEDMEKVIGEKFTTAYFDEQYAQLEALQQGGLSLKTIPLPLLDMEKYQNINGAQRAAVLQKQLGVKLEPEITLVKAGKHKAINLQYLYKQAQLLVSLNNTLVSANDRLYCLISMSLEPQEEAPAAEAEAAADTATADAEAAGGEENALNKMTVGEFKKLMQAQPLTEKELPPAAAARFRKSHAKFLKGFKTLVPAGEPAPLQYTDALAGKTVSLPDDWLYMKMNFAEKDVQANIFCALPYQMLEKMGAAERSVGWYDFLENAGEDTPLEEAAASSVQNEEEAKAKIKEMIAKQLENFDTMLVTVSARSKKDSFVSELTAQPEMTTMAAENFLRSGFKRLQTMGINEYLKLDDYKYDINITAEKALVDIWVRATLLEQFGMDSKLRLAGKDNTGLLLWQLQKTGADVYPQIEQAAEEYRF